MLHYVRTVAIAVHAPVVAFIDRYRFYLAVLVPRRNVETGDRRAFCLIILFCSVIDAPNININILGFGVLDRRSP